MRTDEERPPRFASVFIRVHLWLSRLLRRRRRRRRERRALLAVGGLDLDPALRAVGQLGGELEVGVPELLLVDGLGLDRALGGLDAIPGSDGLGLARAAGDDDLVGQVAAGLDHADLGDGDGVAGELLLAEVGLR